MKTYDDFLAWFKDADLPNRLSVQLTFILYLFAAQALLLLAWTPLRRLMPPKRAASLFALYLLVGQVGVFLLWPRLVAAWLNAAPVTLADVVTVSHFAFIVSVLAVQLCVLVGWPLGWTWTRSAWLRLAHLVAIEIVVGQAIVSIECPLTTVERDLRDGYLYLVKDPEQPASALARFCNTKIFFEPKDVSPAGFVAIYGTFGGLVLLTWFLVPPRFASYTDPSEPAPEPTPSPSDTR